VAAVVSARHFGESPAVPVTARFEVKWPTRSGSTGGGAHFFELSPDARSAAIVSDGYLWVRSRDSLEPVRLDRTQGATYPFWSPDGASIAFFAGGQLRTVSRDGSAVRIICDAADGRGGAWSTQGTIVFAGNSGGQGLSRVTDQGGTPVSLTKVSTSGTSDAHRYPQFLPDNTHFLFLHLTGTTDVAGVYVGSLDGAAPVRVLDGADNARFAAAPESADRGHLLFRRQDSLMAQAFDARTFQVSGPVIAAAADVSEGENTGLGAFSVAAGGTLAHWPEGNAAREIFWMSRSGSRQGVVVPGDNIADFALSWDQRRVALTRVQTERGFESDVWVQALDGGKPTRFTFGPRPGWMSATWSPQGDQIAYVTADQAGLSGYELYRKPLNMSAAVKLLRSDETIWLWDWSPDGKTLVYASGGELWLLPVEGEQKPVLLAKTTAEDQYAQFSPDGKWLAYSSGPRDQTEVFVPPGARDVLRVDQGGRSWIWARREAGVQASEAAFHEARSYFLEVYNSSTAYRPSEARPDLWAEKERANDDAEAAKNRLEQLKRQKP
jgi:Tol biopolymer transport system component